MKARLITVIALFATAIPASLLVFLLTWILLLLSLDGLLAFLNFDTWEGTGTAIAVGLALLAGAGTFFLFVRLALQTRRL